MIRIVKALLRIGSRIINGTAGSVLFADASGNLGQNNSQLFWHTTNNQLAIGHTAPAEKLHVVRDGDSGGVYVDCYEPSVGRGDEGLELYLRRSAGSLASPAAPANAAPLHALRFQTHNGTDFTGPDASLVTTMAGGATQVDLQLFAGGTSLWLRSNSGGTGACVQWGGNTTAPLSDASTGAIYYDSGLQKFRVSQNNGAYENLVKDPASPSFVGVAKWGVD